MSLIRLTQYSHGAGCGCKIAPDVLDGILAKAGPAAGHKQLIAAKVPCPAVRCAIVMPWVKICP